MTEQILELLQRIMDHACFRVYYVDYAFGGSIEQSKITITSKIMSMDPWRIRSVELSLQVLEEVTTMSWFHLLLYVATLFQKFKVRVISIFLMK